MYSSFSLCRIANIIVTLVIGVFQIQLISATKSEIKLQRDNNGEKFLAIQIFGDSVVDTGNNNGLKTLIKSNFPPYGRDFKDGKATGRFSNGKLISDFIAEAFGIKELVPSFHDPNLQSKDLQTGLCFASAGSGYDPLTAKILRVYTQQEQIQFFKEYISKLKSDVGEERTRAILSQSLYVISSGNNDILITYYASQIRKVEYDFPSYADFLVKHASIFLTELYNNGARKIALFNVAPLGCVPFGRTIEGGVHRECSDEINKSVQLYNSKLSTEIASLNNQLHDSQIIIVDVYNPVLEVIQQATEYGFEEIGKGCCSTGTLETGLFCNKLSPTCSNASSYMFWDSIHPTEAAYTTFSIPVIKQIVF